MDKKASPEIMSLAGIITGALSGSVLFLLGPASSLIFILSGIIVSLSAAFMLFYRKNINIPLTFIVLPQISSYAADLPLTTGIHIRKKSSHLLFQPIFPLPFLTDL